MTKTQASQSTYHTAFLTKAEALYAAWKTNKISSKTLVLQAQQHAFNPLIKTDVSHRLRALLFTCALDLRLQRRYRGFLRKCIYVLAFIPERANLRLLRRILGYASNETIEQWLLVQLNRIQKQLSALDENDAEGGRQQRETDFANVEKRLHDLMEECLQQEVQTATALESNTVSVKTQVQMQETDGEDVQTENPVQKQAKQKGKTPNKPSNEKQEKQPQTRDKKLQEKTVKNDTGKEKITVLDGKFMANSSVFQEFPVHEESPSPFPVFKPNQDAEQTDKDESVETQETPEKEREAITIADLNGKEEACDPFPVFKPSKKADAMVKADKEKSEKAAENKQEQADKQKAETQEISEENKARIQLNITMSEEQIKVIADQLQEEAKLIMQEEERKWREKISIDSDNKQAVINDALNVQKDNNASNLKK